MIESTDLALVAPKFITTNPLELVGMIEPLNSGVAFWAL
jgi:hypothetical protein